MIENHNATSDIVNIFRLQLQCIRGLCFPGLQVIHVGQQSFFLLKEGETFHIHVSDFEALAKRF